MKEWGEQTCIYEKCDGNRFPVEFNADTALLILERIQQNNIRIQSTPVQPMRRPSMPKLQKVNDGWILVHQPDSENPDDWYSNDPFKK